MSILKLDQMSKSKMRILSIIFQSDLHGVRATLGIAEIIWFIALIWPGSTFDRPTYTVMSHILTEESWAIIFLFSGLTQLSILYRMDFHSRFSTYFAGWNFALWLYIVISMYISITPPPAAISGELALAFAASWVWIRSGHPAIGRRVCDYEVQK